LRDRSTVAAKELLTAFGKLPAEAQQVQRQPMILALIDSNKPELAFQALDEADRTASDSDKLKFQLLRARTLLLSKKAPDAAKLVAQVVPDQAAPPSALSDQYVILSTVALLANDLNSADTLSTKAIEAYPKNFKAFIQSGRVSLKHGNPDEAIAFAKKALEINQYS
jgi:tetratricopeptide (TPR) repeat protein